MSVQERVRAAYHRIGRVDRPEIWIDLRPEEDVLADAGKLEARRAAGESLPLYGKLAAVKRRTSHDSAAGSPTSGYDPNRCSCPSSTSDHLNNHPQWTEPVQGHHVRRTDEPSTTPFPVWLAEPGNLGTTSQTLATGFPIGTVDVVSTTSTSGRRTAIGVLVALGLVGIAMVSLGATGGLPFTFKPVAGRALAILEEVPGPETGPKCPLDQRYVDEQPVGLRPDVLDAWNKLRAEAGRQQVSLCANDGKRSAGQQQREFDSAVRRFGTAELAARYVLPPGKSMHVKGIAVDIQPLASAAWVEKNGGALGWCRRYENEKWHFEYDPAYATGGCPALLPSATGS